MKAYLLFCSQPRFMSGEIKQQTLPDYIDKSVQLKFFMKLKILHNKSVVISWAKLFSLNDEY